MIGMVVGAIMQSDCSVDNWAGKIQKDATVIEVQRLQPASPGSVFFFLTGENLMINVEHIISGKLDLGTSDTTNSSVCTKYKLDSEQHNLILRCLQRQDPSEHQDLSITASNPKINPPGDENFDHKILLGMKLLIPCNTWDHDDARRYFGVRYRDQITAAFVRKVTSPNTKKVAFDLEFPEIPAAILVIICWHVT